MSEEELNQELSTDEIKDVAGGGVGPMGATGKVPFLEKFKKRFQSSINHPKNPYPQA